MDFCSEYPRLEPSQQEPEWNYDSSDASHFHATGVIEKQIAHLHLRNRAAADQV